MAKLPLKITFETVYGVNEDLSGPPALRQVDRVALPELLGMYRDGQVEWIKLHVMGRNGFVRVRPIWRYTARRYRIRDESCTMGARVIEKLVEALWAGKPCMLSPSLSQK